MELSRMILTASAVLGLAFSNGQAVLANSVRTAQDIQADLIQQNNIINYKIQEGDTLEELTEALNLDKKALEKACLEHKDLELLEIGNILTIRDANKDIIDEIKVRTPKGDLYTLKLEITPQQTSNDPIIIKDLSPQTRKTSDQIRIIPKEEESKEETTNASIVEHFFNENNVFQTTPVYAEEEKTEDIKQTEVETIVEQVHESEDVEDAQENIVKESLVENEIVEDENTAINHGVQVYNPQIEEETEEAEENDDDDNHFEEEKEEQEKPVLEDNDSFDLIIVNKEDDMIDDDAYIEEDEIVDLYDNPENYGLKPHVAEYKERVGSMFDVSDYSTYRPGDPGEHGQGLAVDFMTYNDTEKGDAIADYTMEQMKAGADKISYIIWQQQIAGDWTGYDWEMMEDRGSATANHYDHVHVSFYK